MASLARPAAAASGGISQDGSDNADETSSMAETPMCRICFRGARAGSLLTPCNCRGTIGFVHKACLEEWLSRRNTDECNICSYKFQVERTAKSFWEWLRDPNNHSNRCYILIDMFLSTFGAFMLLVSVWLLAGEIIRGLYSLQGCVLIGVIVALAGLICVADIYLMVNHHYRALLRWRQNNWVAHLVLPASIASESSASPAASDPSPPPHHGPRKRHPAPHPALASSATPALTPPHPTDHPVV
ncbi:E3 ubiquitin-protein ligase MARCHF3-like [Haemaphysalis longicornis]